MKEIFREIYKKIKEYDKIVIARHIGADPDALGSTMGLKEVILNTFPNKKVSVVGVYSSVFKYMGKMDKLAEDEISSSLLIVCDTPNAIRIDGIDDVKKFKYVIKIDHHPEIDKFEDLKWVDTTASSVCQMLIELTYNTRLKMCKSAAEKLYMGLVSDTNRFLYDYTSPKTFTLVSKLISDTKIELKPLYDNLYSRPLVDVRYLGYIAEHFTVTEGGLAYITITDEVLQKFGGDSALSGNIIGNFNNINEVLVWVIFTEDKKQDIIKVNARSRGPVINTTLEKFGGGGHMFASGARLKNKDDIDKLVEDLENLCKTYNKSTD
ncbi:MAG: bifunctional oligoribonuclease/PAP phosphatase NrnA [Bacilli bacterium]|nr:bifunctional oligoribonuclease/PAP phosphatase NrnA [Bacilli bacterium]